MAGKRASRTRPTTTDAELELADLANVGPATLGDFERLGIRTVVQLAKEEPFALYRKLCRLTGQRHDPCVIDVFIATISQCQGKPARPWWKFTPQRKAALAREPALAEFA